MAMAKALAGIIGWPVSHSLSPRLHNYWLSHHKIEGEYVRLAVEPKDLPAAIRDLKAKGLRGANLTIPHKEAAMSLLDEIDEEARIIGAVNTIVVEKDGRLRGTNTDAYGFMANIAPHLPRPRNKAVVLGAGGAARAVCHGLRKCGFGEIVVLNRTQPRAGELSAWFGGALRVEPWLERDRALEGADLLVNTTSLGMTGKEALSINVKMLPAHALVTDIVYAPLETPLLKDAKAFGYAAVDGLGMLLHQAVPAFEAWFGIRPDVTDELRHYVLEGG